MTMADTVAVMNSGRIEQLGHPADIYELPRTVFVANFLGQSNLIKGAPAGRSGEDVLVSAFGASFAVPAARSFATGADVIVGVRPEKMTILDAVDDRRVPEAHNRVHGTVTDVSYSGVSTQYLVRTPWDQELVVFEQNAVVGDRSEVGDEVVVHWSPQHTFGLDGSAGTSVGVDPEVLAVEAAAQALIAGAPGS